MSTRRVTRKDQLSRLPRVRGPRKTELVIESLEQRLLLDASPLEIYGGLDALLAKYSTAIEQDVLALRIPLVGDRLANSV